LLCWQAALEVAPIAICVVEDGWIRFANRACADLWGAASAEALTACELKDLLAAGAEVPTPPAPNGKGSPAVCRAQIVRLDGEPREVEMALASFTVPTPGAASGKSPAVLVQMVLRDITETLREHEHLERSRRELRDLSANLVDAREQERQHIARELHDELGQQLTALKIGLTHLAPSQKAGREDRVTGLIERLDETFESLRRIATDLRPPMLDDLGLNAAIEWLGLESARRLNIEVDLNFADTTPPLADMASIAIYRMVQEALTNVARHAHASKVWIETRCEGGQFSISVRDNGVGFPGEAVGRQGSHGLTGIRERAAILDGTIEIGNAPGGGGCITVRLPLERSATDPGATATEPTPALPQHPARPAWALRSPEAVLHELQVHQIEVEMQNEELRRTQIELAAARDRYVHLYDYAPVGYLTLNRDGLVIEANQTGARLLGEKRSALIRRRLARFVAPEDGDRWHRYLLRALQQDGPQPVELTLQPRGAPPFQAQIDGLRLVPVGAETTLRITLIDITERKRAEIDRRIATRTIESREAERRRVARALHEELGQELSALKMDLACLPSAPPGPVHDQRLADIQTVLDTAVATVRRIATDLRPLLLDDLGLTAAIDWLARDLAQRSGLRITLELDECHPPLNESMSVAVYRMAQEALAQVAHGLSSSQIHIGLRHPTGELVLCLQDNGPDQRALYEERPFDLTELRQQVHLLRGRLDTDARPGGRRRIAIHLPLLRSTDHLSPSLPNKEAA
jgi:PAS domain S-box-containing protein